MNTFLMESIKLSPKETQTFLSELQSPDVEYINHRNKVFEEMDKNLNVITKDKVFLVEAFDLDLSFLEEESKILLPLDITCEDRVNAWLRMYTYFLKISEWSVSVTDEIRFNNGLNIFEFRDDALESKISFSSNQVSVKNEGYEEIDQMVCAA